MIDRLRVLVERLARAPVPLRGLAPVAWAGLIWWLSSRTLGGSSPGLGMVFLFNGGHVVVFGWLAVLLHLALGPQSRGAEGPRRNSGRGPNGRRASDDAATGSVAAPAAATGRAAVRRFWLSCALAAAYGAVDELHQAYVPGRVASVFDWTSDAAGAVLGAAAMTWLRDRPAWAWRTGWWMVPTALVSVGCATVW